MSLNKLVKDELSGVVAKSFVEQITRYHRIQGSTMFHDAAEYVKGELSRIGLKDPTIERFPSDGKIKYWTYTSPIGWTVRSAELHLVEPEEKLIARYEDVPTCLHTYSKATPPEGTTAELIDVGAGMKPKDYDGKDVKGKIVLATGRASTLHEQAVWKRGAVAVLTDSCWEFPNVRESLDIPDAHAYQGIWPKAENLDKVTFGFSLSKRQGNQLRRLLKGDKPVKLKAKVDAELFPNYEDVITATIQGRTKPEEEIFLVAHLCHPKPSANDNASGSGLLLEIARTLTSLISSGKIPPPERTIRFFWVPETLGTVAYLSHHEDMFNRFIAGINMDMVGQDQELCKSTLNLDRTPDSCPSYLNDYVYSLIEQSIEEFDRPTPFGSSSTFRYRQNSFSGGSDHAEFTESTVGVPCIMLLQWPDLYYHTSQDTPDKVSEDSLKRVGWIATVAAFTLANATPETAFRLASLTASKGITRIEDATTEATEELFKKKDDPKLKEKPEELAKELAKTAMHYRNKLEHVIWREQQATKSVTKLGENPELTTLINKLVADLANQSQQKLARFEETLAFIAKTQGISVPAELEETAAETELEKLVPKRQFKGTLAFDVLKDALGEKEYEWYQEIYEKDPEFGKKSAEYLNFIDGKRTAHDILKAVSAEYGETNPEQVLKFLRDLEKAKLLTFQ